MLILFENASVECDNERFDLVIKVLTAPVVWLETLRQTIEDAKRLREQALQLLADCADA